jgi:DNA polymerase-3 subunit beta
MKFRASKADLAAALGTVTRIVDTRNVIEILGNIRIDAEAGGVRLTANNLEMMVVARCAADVAAEGSTTVPARRFLDLVQSLPNGSEMTFSTEGAAGRASFTSGRCRGSLSVLDPKDFPSLDAVVNPCTFAMKGTDLSGLLSSVDFAVSNEVTRFFLCGVYLHAARSGDGDVLRAVATDGGWLGRSEIPCPAGAATMPSVIIPTKAVAEFRKLADAAKDDDLTISVSKDKIAISAGSVEITSKLIEGTFPDYNRIFAASRPQLAVLDVAELAAAINRVATVGEERGQGVHFAFSDDGLKLKLANASLGEIEEDVACEYDGTPVQIEWSARKAKGLAGALSGDTIRIELSHSRDNAVWSSPTDTSRLYAIAPVVVGGPL